MGILLTILLDASSCTLNIILGVAVSGLVSGIIGYLIGRSAATNPVPSFNGMDASLAQSLVSNYVNNCNDVTYTDSVSGATQSVSDAYSVWFPLDTILGFANKISSAPVPSSTLLGIRIYYGRYPDTPANCWPGLKNTFSMSATATFTDANSYACKHTVVMVPTYQLNQGGMACNVDFDPNSLSGPAADIPAAMAVFNAAMSSGNTVALCNHGEIVPPPDPNSASRIGGLTPAQSCGAFLS